MHTMKGRKIQFSVSIPYELFEKVCQDVHESRRSKAAIVTDALRLYYEKLPQSYVKHLRDLEI